MNLLEELLNATSEPSVVDVRSATNAALTALRHDRRVQYLDLETTKEVTSRLFNTQDVRTFEVQTGAMTEEAQARNMSGFDTYVHRMLIEVVDSASLRQERVQQVQRVAGSRGGLMRVADVPFRLHLYDRQLALLPRDFDDNQAGAVAIREPGLLATLASLHARRWRQGQKWAERGTGARGATVDLMDVLEQLLNGATDQTAAERLHVSLRTYRRKVQELLGLLGAHSRFQAGVIAEKRHYIELVRAPSDDQSPNVYEATLNELLPSGG